MRKVVLLGIVAAVVTGSVLAAGALATRSAPKAAAVKIGTRKLPKLGQVLVNGNGLTRYMFVPDKKKKVTCVKTCAVVWPPVKLAKGQKAVATGLAEQSLIASDPNPAGGRVATYAKWPLYTYVLDTKPGQVKGQATNLNGGLWGYRALRRPAR